MNYVAYYRVSTKEQGNSGLGLESQRTDCLSYIDVNGVLVGEFTDIESGASNERKGILEAIAHCKLHSATLVVKEMSRISRGGFKIMVMLEEFGINFIEATSPYDPEMVKGIKFVLAKDERAKISSRTTAALSEIKSKLDNGERHISKAGNEVKRLGNPKNLTDASREASIRVRRERILTNPDNIKAFTLISALSDGGSTFYQITKVLNEGGFKTSRGNKFSQVTTKRLYEQFTRR